MDIKKKILSLKRYEREYVFVDTNDDFGHYTGKLIEKKEGEFFRAKDIISILNKKGGK